jgi:hypothetical protein
MRPRCRCGHTVTSASLALPHMPATGVSGIDLYALDGGQWKWVEVSRPKEVTTVHTVSGIDPGLRSWMAYLPLYNSTVKVEIGVPKGSTFQPVAPRKEKPIVFYGTSITHGASASRPGMPHPAILGRRLNKPVINLGFFREWKNGARGGCPSHRDRRGGLRNRLPAQHGRGRSRRAGRGARETIARGTP